MPKVRTNLNICLLGYVTRCYELGRVQFFKQMLNSLQLHSPRTISAFLHPVSARNQTIYGAKSPVERRRRDYYTQNTDRLCNKFLF